MSKKRAKEKYIPEKTKPGRPITARIATKEAEDRYSTYPASGLTPRKLASIFREADGGDVFRQMELFEEMEEKDTHLFSQLQTRKLAVAGLDWEIQPFNTDPVNERIAEFVQDQLRSQEEFDDTIIDLLDAIGKGISFCEIGWGYQNGHTVIDCIEHIHPKKFFWDSMTDEIKVRTKDFPGGIELPDNKYVIHKYKARSGHPAKAGVLRVVAWMYLFKNYDIKDWVSFCEVYGMPLRLGTYDATASEDDKTALMNAIINLGTDAAGIVPSGTSIQFIESNKQSSVDIYEKLARFCDEQISKAVVGQTLTSDSGSGSFSQSKTHNEVRKDLTAADCKALSSTIRRDLITPLVQFNFGTEAKIPGFVINSEDADDLKETAEILNTLTGAGLQIPQSYVYKKFNIPQPEKGEDVLRKPEGISGQMTSLALKEVKAQPDREQQKIIDGMIQEATKQSEGLFEQMLKPIVKIVDGCKSLEELQMQLKNETTVKHLYASMNEPDLEKLLEKVLYLSNMVGRTYD